jgi:hypothetical protein
VGIGVTDPGISKLYVRQDDTTAAGGTTGVTIDVNLSGSDATAGDPVYRGLFVDMDSTATGGNTDDEHRMYGIFCDVRHSGDSDLVYSGYFYARSDHSAGTNSSLRGVYSSAVDSAGGTNSSIIAGEFKALKDGGSGNTTATMMGVRAEVEIDAGTITNAYGVYSQIDRDGGTVNTSYLFYGLYSGSDTGNRRGIWVEGVENNYISGKLGIDKTVPETALHVNGSITVGDIGAYAGHNDGQLILGGTHNEGYNRNNYIKLLISGGNNDGGSPYYIMCEDENGFDQLYVKGATNSNGESGMSLYVRGRIGIGRTPSYRLDVDGDIRVNSTVYTSDDRIKYNEEDVVNALALISQLKPQKYEKILEQPIPAEGTWIPTDEEWENVKGDYKHGDEFGFIAQDIRNIPELAFLVHGEETGTSTKTLKHNHYINLTTEEQSTYTISYVHESNTITQVEYSNLTVKEQATCFYTKQIESQTILNLNYQGLFVLAIGAIQELKAKIETLEEHTHPLEPHTHPLEPHTHPLEPHTHPLEPHTHPLEPHTHPLEEHTHQDLVDQLTTEKAKTYELENKVMLLNMSYASLIQRIEALEKL